MQVTSRRTFIGIGAFGAVGSLAAARELGGIRNVLGGTPAVVLRRSSWVWGYEDVASLLEAAGQAQISRLHVWFAPGDSTRSEALERFVALTSAAASVGIAVDGLGGDPGWVDEPNLGEEWAEELRSLGSVDRLHLDVEPHGHADWTARPQELCSGFLEVVKRVGRSGLAIDVDVPIAASEFQLRDGRRLLPNLLKEVDSLTVMAYRSTAAEVIEVAEPVVRHAEASATPVWIGVNLTDPGTDPPHTVLGYGGVDRRSEILQLEHHFATETAVVGLSFHHSASLSLLAR